MYTVLFGQSNFSVSPVRGRTNPLTRRSCYCHLGEIWPTQIVIMSCGSSVAEKTGSVVVCGFVIISCTLTSQNRMKV